MNEPNQHGYYDQPHAHPTQAHLTDDQFGELVERGALEIGNAAAEAHLRTCKQCSAELTSMHEALALFRETTSAFAEREFARTRRVQANRLVPAYHSFSPGLAWAAAGLLVIATALPLSLRHKAPPAPSASHPAAPAAPAPISDEALLDDINREVSAPIPASMQALENPTGSASLLETDAQTSSTRKN